MGELHASLDAMGVEQQACVLAFLVSYPLTLGALFEQRGRRMAAGVAAVSVVCFGIFTDPWFHAVLLVALAIGAIGLFIMTVYVIDRVSRHYAFKGLPIEEVEFVDSDEPDAEPALPQPASGHPRFPVVGVVSVKH
ncbi:hypothetical protein DZC73_00435 [Albitalea terrae]|uniref:Uncharacterized protein n=2 Tax=Piscinibacter terrae TaxID=2496871 RepID=A0A3N7HUS6_9BURK|nr:hypothetical protein DZC73_00435 [Albitalea terrae]